jgi:hypothetical protein
MKPGLPEYEEGMLTTRLERSVLGETFVYNANVSES